MWFGSWDITLLFALNSLAGRTPFMDRLIVFTASDLPYLVVAGFVLYLYCRRSLSQKQKTRAFGIALFAALIARIGLGSPIRFFFPRPRPFLTYPMHQLIPENAPGFPSGHALFFFAFSTIVFAYDRRLGIATYVASIFIVLARVAAGIHYPSDILAGAILGTICGALVWHFSKSIPIFK